MRMRRVLSLALGLSAVLLLCLALPAFAAGKAEEKPVIRVAHTFTGANTFAEYLEPAMQQFADARKDQVTFKFEPADVTDIRTKIKTEMAAGEIPDIFDYWPGGAIEPMVKANLLLDVGKYLEKSKSITWDSFSKESWAGAAIGTDKFYAIPLYGSTNYLVVNRALFQKYNVKYPETYEDLKAAAKVFTANGIIPLAVGSKGGNTSHWLYAFLVQQYASPDLVKGITAKTVNFTTTPALKKGAELVLDMAKNGIFPKDTMANSEYTPTMALYNERKAAMILGFPWTSNSFTPEITEESDIIHFPRFPNAVNDPKTFTIGGTNHIWVISRAAFENPAKQKHIVEFMDFLLSDQVFQQMAKSGRDLIKLNVPSPEGLTSMAERANRFTEKLVVKSHLWIPMPSSAAQEAYNNALDALWAQAITADEFCKKIQTAIDSQ